MAQSMLLRRGAGVAYCDRILYTGRMIYDIRFMENRAYHLFTLEASGVLTVIGSLKGDIWMCGGGGGGNHGYFNGYNSAGVEGAGGGGGYVFNAFGVSILSGLVTIGAGTAGVSPNVYTPLIGGSTEYLSYSAAGGRSAYAYYSYPTYYSVGGSGGCGGGAYINSHSGLGAGVSTRPFLSQDMRPQCGGGGCGCCSGTSSKMPGGGSDGSGATQRVQNADAPGAGAGGSFGGGGGGDYGQAGGSNGAAGCASGSASSAPGGAGGFGYGGGGGGGGGKTVSNGSNPNAGAGTSGAMMLRIPV